MLVAVFKLSKVSFKLPYSQANKSKKLKNLIRFLKEKNFGKNNFYHN